MKLYFLRHGIAEDAREGLPDARRRLTREGVRQMGEVALGMRALKVRPDLVLTSPYPRARETAEIAAKALGCAECLRAEPRLASGAGYGDIAAALEGCAPEARVLLVGHEPDFSEAISALIGGGAVRMKKASLACVDAPVLAPGRGELRWLLTPKQLCLLGAKG